MPDILHKRGASGGKRSGLCPRRALYQVPARRGQRTHTPAHTQRERPRNERMDVISCLPRFAGWLVGRQRRGVVGKTKFHWGYLFIAAVHAHGACTAKATTDTHTHTYIRVCTVERGTHRHTPKPWLRLDCEARPGGSIELRLWLWLKLTHLLLRKFVIKRF